MAPVLVAEERSGDDATESGELHVSAAPPLDDGLARRCDAAGNVRARAGAVLDGVIGK